MSKSNNGKAWKTILKIIAIVLGVIILIVAGYLAYVFISYHRIGDQPITPEGEAVGTVQTGTEYKIVSYNIGFGAYEDDFGFFMDGGDRAWAWSKERLDTNLKNIAKLLSEQKADLYLVQEVDIDATRSYHFDERPYLTDALTGMAYTFAQNYDSPFLFYPITQPHGAAKAGLLTFSFAPIASAERVELPIETGFTKFLDLDRCYSKNRIPTENGKELVLYNMHLSAYTSDGTIATEQLKLLLSDMQAEYEKGNYCIAGGDFNKDLLGDSSKYFGKSDIEYTWAQPIPEETFNGFDITLVAPIDESNPVASCRNADGPYHEGQYKLTVDGFLISANVELKASDVIDVAFKYSDHNPVEMAFVLN
ncbi:MAG: endonuclease/exonuclease/phosphatase family protein [Clostridia bacterium]|nr:endonuclease/exonuclease/phosphatase family protein [Clostridia bacterium]